jgi:predicted  nucleic acid-binding Zn-ribbon protein
MVKTDQNFNTMNKGMNRERMIAGGCALLFAGAMTFTMMGRMENAGLRTKLEEQTSNNARLLDQSTQLQKDLASINGRLADLREQEQILQERLKKEEQMRADAERKAASSVAVTRKPDVSKKELEDLRAEKARLEQMLATANGRLGDLTAENSRLKGNNDKLSTELAQTSEAAASVNNSMVLAARGTKKEKLVVKAKRTQHLNVDFELPEAMAKDVRTKITAPNGKVLDGGAPIVTASNSTHPGEATVSTKAGGAIRRMSRINVKVDAKKEKLVPGTYKVDVFAGSKYLGTTRTTLR